METLLFFINLVLLLGLIILIIYESRQLKNYKETMELFIESNSEIFGVVNANANVSREMQDRLINLEKFAELSKTIHDTHGHALRIHTPDWAVLNQEDRVQDLKNF